MSEGLLDRFELKQVEPIFGFQNLLDTTHRITSENPEQSSLSNTICLVSALA
ncbi:MAG: hypothetical protein HOH62_02065 [Verrucomicrobia bacterium]|nr:hypothetical protein [Verrucomicrobiota bacterium]